MSNIQPQGVKTFDFAPGLQLRSITKDGESWFVCTDVCKALYTTNTSQAVAGLDADEKGFTVISTPGGNQKVLAVNESGLYSLIIRSRKAEAKPFRRWVTGTVIPSIRKDGIYITGQEKPIPAGTTLPELLAQHAAIQAQINAFTVARVNQWSARHQEEKDARSIALRSMRGSRSYRAKAAR
ncbi:MAG: BRO family protein [Burkholderiaceae bacterium]